MMIFQVMNVRELMHINLKIKIKSRFHLQLLFVTAFNDEGLMIRKEIEISYQDAILVK